MLLVPRSHLRQNIPQYIFNGTVLSKPEYPQPRDFPSAKHSFLSLLNSAEYLKPPFFFLFFTFPNAKYRRDKTRRDKMRQNHSKYNSTSNHSNIQIHNKLNYRNTYQYNYRFTEPNYRFTEQLSRRADLSRTATGLFDLQDQRDYYYLLNPRTIVQFNYFGPPTKMRAPDVPVPTPFFELKTSAKSQVMKAICQFF